MLSVYKSNMMTRLCFTVKLFIGPGKAHNCFGRGYLKPLKRNHFKNSFKTKT